MKPITEPRNVEFYDALARKMTLSDGDVLDGEFDPVWARNHNWKVVPVESGARIPPSDIPRLVAVLSDIKCERCVAIAMEPLGERPRCYSLRPNEAEFLEFNRELGLFRILLTDDGGSWAISCNEWYNLFAGKQVLLESLLGKSIEQARQDFTEFADTLGDEYLLKVAKHYAAL